MHNYSNKPANREYSMKIRKGKKVVLKTQKRQIDEEKLSGRLCFELDQRHRLNKEQRQQIWRRKCYL